MTTQAEAEEAISKFNGFDLDNRELKVNIAKPREDRGGRSSRQSGRKNRR
jgi:RNA recognition motif-containing protein